MRFDLYFRTYNTFGGHRLLSASAAYLMEGCPEVGNALRELEIQLWIPAGRRARKTLEKLYEQYEQNRQLLPDCKLRRFKRVVEINIASDFSTGLELEGLIWHTLESSPDVARKIAQDCVRALEYAESNVQSSAADAVAQIAEHFRNRLHVFPASAEALRMLNASTGPETKGLTENAGWESEINWDEYHPSARSILDHEFYWEIGDEFAPHGNDSGSDLLEYYRKWRKRLPGGDPMQFVAEMSAAWGIPADWDGQEDLMHLTIDEMMIAVAFAELKLCGDCDPRVAAGARDSIARRRAEAMKAKEWSHRENRLKTLEKMERKLAGY